MSKPLAILYFTRDKTDVANDIAARIRNEGNLVNMVFAGGFRSPDMAVKCEAVIIQASCGRAPEIVDAYQKQFPEAEIHMFNDEGEFDDASAPPPTDTGSEEEAAEPAAAEEEASDDTSAEDGDDSGKASDITE